MGKIKLYCMKGACSLASRILINELKIDADFDMLDRVTRKTEDGVDYALVNKKGAVPALKLANGEVLTEGAAILQYLCDNYNGSDFLPSGKDLSRYRVVEWMNYVSTEIHKGIAVFFNANIPQELKSGIYTDMLKSKMKFLDENFAKNKYLIGNDICIADFYLFVCVSWTKHVGFDISEYKNVARFINDVASRDAVKTSLQQEGLVA